MPLQTFDWVRFLDSAGVEYLVGPGGKVRRGHVGINCPRCHDDEGFHFSIELGTGKIRGCWRDGEHWMPPVQLISELGSISYSAARAMFEEGVVGDLGTDSLSAQLEALDAKYAYKAAAPLISWPEEVQQISAAAAAPFGKMYWNYMRERGFHDPGKLGEWFGLRWCRTGDWSHRILFPLKNFDGGLVGWTGRDVTGTSPVKYKTNPPGAGVGSMVFGYEPGLSGEVLLLTEGPIDAAKVDYYAGPERDVHAIALLGLNAGKAKWATIERISRTFNHVVICLDSGEDASAHALRDQLSVLNASVVYTPEGHKDLGELTPVQVGRFWDGLLAGLPA